MVHCSTSDNKLSPEPMFNILRPRQNGRHFADDIFKCIFLNENIWISLKISLKFVPEVRINIIAALVQIMAWRRSGDKPLSGTMMVSLLTHISVTRPQLLCRHMASLDDVLRFWRLVGEANLGFTHWGRVSYIYVIKLNIIGSDNGLSDGRRQAIIWTNAGILLIWLLGTNFSEMLVGIPKFSFKKMHFKTTSAKRQPIFLGLNMLK